MNTKKRIGNKFILISAICAIAIPSVSYAEEVISSENFASSSNLYEGQNTDILKSSLYLGTYKNPFNYQFISTLKETNKNIKKIDNTEDENPVIATTLSFIRYMDTEDYKSAIDLTSRSLKKVISEEWLKSYWKGLPAQLQAGSFMGIGEGTQKETNSVHTNVEIKLVFEQITVPLLIKLDLSGKIDDFQLSMPFSPVAERPSYSRPELFVDKEVVVGSGAFPLPGTLSVPKGKGPFPAVILVHADGAADQDETAYALKPFRDLAEGLASKGIAVLRYNKRTYEHGLKTELSPFYTVDKGTTDDALLVTHFLQNEPMIDKNQIYILGHSLGGMMIPKVIEKDQNQNIAGAIVMGGAARAFTESVLDQLDYRLSIGAMKPEEYKFYKSQFELLNDPNFSSQNPPKDFQLGSPVFWDSIRKIKAAEMSKEQKTPLLILQGERDFQVQSKIEIPFWKEQLKERDNVEYRLYPKLNHFFTEGDGELSKPDEYYNPANIPEYVINDIATWVQGRSK
ncbi:MULTISPECIES: alpha/beta hydrolase [Bacillus cereus group]|uniref:alpha/beta hydrolase n=1 Tax=Bacillus cereus group TaxID=86661 RepID=UPI00298D3CE8|nr:MULTISPECIES: prolyl oligopeptidase family serine peptidase [Bacillus cereus group]MEC2921239.1 prolyl oligopeptidase family serine peptidase [Bacillus tropicus]MEC2926733.1 prolyl oligopeptidase family serine peptidase [Bacillus tropicus]MEC2956038.1 prolyl oligopeptidase family serine peptidase [Bacillus tropicus]MEC3051240.1 prolyl oligopeptidase family serine peptidase [Bacillus tropicus]MEC3077370.1 prolyl oligopeptidase family serine peptidase [Bacillus tropicus]